MAAALAAFFATFAGCGPAVTPLTETSLAPEATEGAPQKDGAAMADAIARWDAAKANGDARSGAEEAAVCAAGITSGALSADDAAKIVSTAVEGMLRSPRFIERRVRAGLWEGDVLKVNAAQSDPGGGRKILLGEGQLVRQFAFTDGGKRSLLTVRSSVENPQLVADGASLKRRDIVLLEIVSRYAFRASDAFVLVDGASQLAAVVTRAGKDWRADRIVDLAGTEESLEALCRAVARQ